MKEKFSTTVRNKVRMATTEIRGVWLTTTDSKVLHSRGLIAEAMDFLANTGFNVVFPDVWHQGVTVYPSRIMCDTFDIEIDPLFAGHDPLTEVVTEAHRVGLKVIPWFQYGFASSYNLNGGMIIQKKPEWAGRDNDGKLLNKNGFEWLNALNPEVQNFLISLVLEVVNNYEVDGIQGDDRFPAFPSEGGYDQQTKARYQREKGINPPQNCKDQQWLQWRADILTDFLSCLYQQVKAVDPNLLVSMAPSMYDWGFKEYLQDTPKWLKLALVDLIHPQVYRRDFPSYKANIDRLLKEQFTDATLPKLAPGILMKVGAYVITADDLLQTIKYNRDRGILGEVFFFYEGLRSNNHTLAQVLRKDPYAQSAKFPTIADLLAR